jgi:photosystem II stability/assembly factor-like uncharacterized protein
MKARLLFLSLLLTSFGLFSQSTVWEQHNANLDTTSGIRYMDAVDTNVVWAIGYDGTYTARTYIQFTRCIDGQNFTAGTFLPDTMDYSASNISAIDDSVAFIACYSKNATLSGIVLRTMDGGATWTNIASPAMFTGSANFPNVVHFYDISTGWVMGDPNNTGGSGNEFEIWRTSDSGSTWSRVPSANLPNPSSGEYGLTDVYTTNGTMNIWYGTNKGRVYYSTDGGNMWSVSSPGGMAGGVQGLAFKDPMNGIVWGLSATTSGAFVMKQTTNGGVNWTTIAVNSTDVGRNALCAIPGYGFMSCGINVAQSGYVTSASFDNGVTWTVLETGISNLERMLEVEMLDSIHGWAGDFEDNTLPTGMNGMAKYIGGQLTVGLRPVAEVNNNLVYPNPSNGQITVRLGKAKSGTKISVRSILGTEVYSTTLTSTAINQNVNMDLSKFDKGIYFVNIISDGNVEVQKVIIE